MELHDVVIIGAGLAGLRCATRLAEAGREVVVLEASDAVGGRQRTDVVDGFQLDRGFQVLNPAYPAVQRWVDIDAFQMRTFPVGVRVRRAERTVELWHPLRHPTRVPSTLASGLISPRDAAALSRWIVPALLRPRSVITGVDRTLRAGWERAGLRGPLREEVLEPFLAGVLADDRGTTSDAFAKLLVRMFVLGRPGVPTRGIGALPEHLAAVATGAGAGIRLGMRVTGLRSRRGTVEVRIRGARAVRARSVIVAVGPDAVAGLLDVPRPATRGLQTWWFASNTAPRASGLLAVDGRRAGPILNSVVLSNTAPSYAPPGQHLIAATCLLPSPGAGANEREVRTHSTQIWQTDTARWRLLRRDDIVDALPVQSAPLRVRTPARVAAGLFVAGDHRDTASIQGALASGDRVARLVLSRGHGHR